MATTSWAAGQQQTVSWKDDGAAPSLTNFGPSKVSVYVGSQTQQVSFFPLELRVDRYVLGLGLEGSSLGPGWDGPSVGNKGRRRCWTGEEGM